MKSRIVKQVQIYFSNQTMLARNAAKITYFLNELLPQFKNCDVILHTLFCTRYIQTFKDDRHESVNYPTYKLMTRFGLAIPKLHIRLISKGFTIALPGWQQQQQQLYNYHYRHYRYTLTIETCKLLNIIMITTTNALYQHRYQHRQHWITDLALTAK